MSYWYAINWFLVLKNGVRLWCFVLFLILYLSSIFGLFTIFYLYQYVYRDKTEVLKAKKILKFVFCEYVQYSHETGIVCSAPFTYWMII